jgi:hypothetical protein
MGHGGVAGNHDVLHLFGFGTGTVQGLSDQAVDSGQGHAALFFDLVFFGADNARVSSGMATVTSPYTRLRQART